MVENTEFACKDSWVPLYYRIQTILHKNGRQWCRQWRPSLQHHWVLCHFLHHLKYKISDQCVFVTGHLDRRDDGSDLKKCTAFNFFNLVVHSAVLNRVGIRRVAKQTVLPFLMDVWQQVNNRMGRFGTNRTSERDSVKKLLKLRWLRGIFFKTGNMIMIIRRWGWTLAWIASGLATYETVGWFLACCRICSSETVGYFLAMIISTIVGLYSVLWLCFPKAISPGNRSLLCKEPKTVHWTCSLLSNYTKYWWGCSLHPLTRIVSENVCFR